MNGSVNRGNYRPPMGGRRRKDTERSVMMGIIAVLLAAVIVFAVLVIAEICREEEEIPNEPNEPITPAAKFQAAEVDIPTADIHSGLLILINEDHPYVFPESTPDIVPIVNNRESHGTSASGNPIYSYYTQNGVDKCAKMESSTLARFQEWADAFYQATGNSDLFVLDKDGYRGNTGEDAGVTEHHTGKVVDLYVYTGKIRGNIDDAEFAPTFKWIYENAYKYGFVHRYSAEKAAITGVDDEPYHFRYVGYPHSYYMEKNGLCLEEYLDKVKTCTYEAPLEFRADDGNSYMVYYFPASESETTSLKVPAEYSYTVSGDNVGGFVVTVEVNK